MIKEIYQTNVKPMVVSDSSNSNVEALPEGQPRVDDIQPSFETLDMRCKALLGRELGRNEKSKENEEQVPSPLTRMAHALAERDLKILEQEKIISELKEQIKQKDQLAEKAVSLTELATDKFKEVTFINTEVTQKFKSVSLDLIDQRAENYRKQTEIRELKSKIKSLEEQLTQFQNRSTL